MEVFGTGEAILPKVHSREHLKSSHRLLVHDQSVASLAQPASGQTQLSQPMSHLFRAKFGSVAPRFYQTVDLDSDLPCEKLFCTSLSQSEHRFDDQGFSCVQPFRDLLLVMRRED